MSKVYLVHLFLFILIKAHNSVHEITKAKGSSIEVMCFNGGIPHGRCLPTTNFFHINVLLPSHEGYIWEYSLTYEVGKTIA